MYCCRVSDNAYRMYTLEYAAEIVVQVSQLFGAIHVVCAPNGGQQCGHILLFAVFVYD